MFIQKSLSTFANFASLIAFQGALLNFPFVAPSWGMYEESVSCPETSRSVKKVTISSGESIAYVETEGQGTPLVLIHANSTSKAVFDHQLAGLGQTYKVIAFDLPGHGDSDDAKDPHAVYSFPGYAKALIDAIERMGLKETVVCGLSLGGHVAIEMLEQRPDLVSGIVITGAPPIPLTAEGIAMGFKPFEGIDMIGQETSFTKEQAEKFLTMGGFEPTETLVQAGMRTDGKARSHMMQSIVNGIGSDQKEVVENSSKPFAIICGTQDAGINNNYIKNGVSYNENLFKIFELGCGHACPSAKPEEFNAAIKEFMEFVVTRKK